MTTTARTSTGVANRHSAKNSDRTLVTIAEAADYAACCHKTIRRRIADGSIPAYRFGKRALRVDLNDLDQALRQIPTAAYHGAL
jgi:excisionase family DNA binding protein